MKIASDSDVLRDKSVPTGHSPALVVGKSFSRVSALDFTKGALVLFMVLYHWLNYFVAAQGFFYRYLRFLTPSFIFIAGFLVSNIYFPKYEKGDRKVPRRLLVRGVKILTLFLILNLAIEFLISISATGHIIPPHFSVAMPSLYIFGTTSVAGVKSAVFYVLIPISYLLLVSAALLTFTGSYKYTFHLATALCLLMIFLLDRQEVVRQSVPLQRFQGFIGVVLTRDRMQDTSLVQFANDRNNTFTEPNFVWSIFNQDAIPQRVVQIPYDTFDWVATNLGRNGEYFSHKIHQTEIEHSLIRVVGHDLDLE